MEKHLDNIDAMKENIQKDIETLFNKLNVKNFVSSPGPVVDALIFAITQRIVKKYLKPIIKESQGYSKNVLGKSKKEL
jgi:hypothetical protein